MDEIHNLNVIIQFSNTWMKTDWLCHKISYDFKDAVSLASLGYWLVFAV